MLDWQTGVKETDKSNFSLTQKKLVCRNIRLAYSQIVKNEKKFNIY